MDDLKRDTGWLLTEKYLGIETEGFKHDLERLKQGEPLAYLIGNTPFLDTYIYLDSHPLIPRPETEFWVEQAIGEIDKLGVGQEVHVLDLCAGSGCVGIAVLKSVATTIVDFAEIDTEHHKTIRKNLIENDIDPHRAAIMGGDLYEHISSAYDFILANPPYIDETLERTERSVHDYEPHKALYAQDHGFNLIARIIEGALSHLTDDGVLYLEHEPEQVADIHELATSYRLVGKTYKDQFGVERFTHLTRQSEQIVSQ